MTVDRRLESVERHDKTAILAMSQAGRARDTDQSLTAETPRGVQDLVG